MSLHYYTPPSSKIIHYTYADFVSRQIGRPVHIVQYDDSIPILAVRLYRDGQNYAVPANADVSIKLNKPDGNFVYNPALGCDEDRQMVYFEITPQMAVLAGEVSPVIEIANDGEIAASSSIGIKIDRNPIQDEDMESTGEYKSVVRYAKEAVDAAADASASRSASKISETNAKASETKAKTSETNAKASETKAKTSETNARESELKAKTSETNAKESETNAKESETKAKTSETNAKESETKAKTSETNARESERKAKESEDNAKESETKAKTSETNAKTSETNAKASEDNAEESERKAKTSETNAKTSETNAKASETNAKQYADSWKGSLLPKGFITFSQLPASGNVAGHMYHITHAFVTDSRFEDGAGYSYAAGTNVYWTSDGKWDCLSGNITKEVVQSEYDALTEEEKMSGTIFYISDSDNLIDLATDTVAGVVKVDKTLSSTSENPVQNKVVKNEIDKKANLVSPTLTGTPTAPTAPNATNSTQIATTAFVKAVVNALINGAPETLDTIKELADAVTANKNMADALNSAIGTKVNKSGDTMNGLLKAHGGISLNSNTPNQSLDYILGVKPFADGGNIIWESKGNVSVGNAVNADTVDGKHASDLQNYNNLSNKPSIPSVGNGTITIKQAGTSKGTFTMNQSGNTTIELTDNNTWRGIQNSLTSDSTTDSLSAAQGKALANGSARDSTKLPTAGGTISGALTVAGDTTLQGNVRIKKASSNYGSVINIGDGDYIRISEDSDDVLTVKAKQININSTNANAVYINGQLALRFKKLTQAEYDALPSTKNSDNVLYFITG